MSFRLPFIVVGIYTLFKNKREYKSTNAEIFSYDGKVIATVEKELDPLASLPFNYLYFAGDQTLGFIESLSVVDLESFSVFVFKQLRLAAEFAGD